MTIKRKTPITVYKDGSINFQCSSELYGTTDAGGKAIHALKSGFVPLGDGCDYILTKKDKKDILDQLDMTWKKLLQEMFNIPEENMNNYCSDLHILFSEEVWKWLMDNYEFPQNIKVQLSNVKGQSWYGKQFIEIPFVYTEYHTKRKDYIKSLNTSKG